MADVKPHKPGKNFAMKNPNGEVQLRRVCCDENMCLTTFELGHYTSQAAGTLSVEVEGVGTGFRHGLAVVKHRDDPEPLNPSRLAVLDLVRFQGFSLIQCSANAIR